MWLGGPWGAIGFVESADLAPWDPEWRPTKTVGDQPFGRLVGYGQDARAKHRGGAGWSSGPAEARVVGVS